MSKVVSLAARRGHLLSMVWSEEEDAPPFEREQYDAWTETDGTVVLCFDAKHVIRRESPLHYGHDPSNPAFIARGDVFVIRLPAHAMAQFQDDVDALGYCSRERGSKLRGDHLWRCTPVGDGTYRVEHERETGIFEPFKPRLSAGRVDRFGRTRGVRAPVCASCRRAVQAGETMYRERREKDYWRNFGRAELCSTCIANAPNTGIADAGGEP